MSLQAQLDDAMERISQLEDLLGIHIEFPPRWNLSKRESELLGLLLNREIVNEDMFMTIVCSGRANDMDCDPRSYIAQYVHRLRKKLEPFGISINNLWARGWFIKQNEKTRLRWLIERENNGYQSST